MGKSIDFCYWIPISARWIALGEKSWNGQHNGSVLLMLQIKKKKAEYGRVIKLCICLRSWRKTESYPCIFLYLGFSSTSSLFLIFCSPQEKLNYCFLCLLKGHKRVNMSWKPGAFFLNWYLRIIQKSRFHCNQCMAVIIFFFFDELVVGWFFLNNMWRLIFFHHIFHISLQC